MQRPYLRAVLRVSGPSEAGAGSLMGDTWIQGRLLVHYSGWTDYWVYLLPGSSLVQEGDGFVAEAVTDEQCVTVGTWVFPENL